MIADTTTDDLGDDGFYVTCPECWGEGGWHDCGEDTCACLYPERHTEQCWQCDGTGEVLSPDPEAP